MHFAMTANETVCQHCGGATTGKVYRVTSEEEGVVLLNMIVCRPCCLEARKLKLKTAEIDPGAHRNVKSA